MKTTNNNTQLSCSLTPASMGREKILSRKSLTVISAVLALMVSLATAARAQSEALRQLYATSATIPTNIEGIRAYPAPPEGFNALTASDEELAAYGIPLRPDEGQDPEGYRHWTRVAPLMSNPRHRWNGALKPRKAHGNLATGVPSEGAAQGTTFGATSATGHGWSGVVNTLPLTTWSSSQSFSWVTGEFIVPWPQQAFASGGGNICDGDTDQASLWVGLGGLTVSGVNLGKQNNIAQAGVDIYASCSDQGTYAWVEWYPGPSAMLFGVNPGDDIYVNVQNFSATSAIFVIVDATIQQSASYGITAPSGVQLVGSEAEYIVERPVGDSTPTGLFPLANYGWASWVNSEAEDFAGNYHYPGGTSPETFDISMTDDSGTSIISQPTIGNGTDAWSMESLFVAVENCARVGGCTP